MTTLWKLLLLLCLCVAGFGNEVSEELTQNLIPCREDWHLFGEKCYKVQGESKGLSWKEASAQCSREGGNLATIYSKEMRDFMFTFLLLNVASDAWIGLNDREQEQKFVWDDGSVFNYTDWEPNEPSGEKSPWEDCVLMRYWTHKSEIGSWNDFECYTRVPYICQQAKDEKYQNPDPRFCSVEKGGGWKYLNSCYHIVTEEKSWEDAEEYCQEHFKGHLATLLDFRTEYFLNYILSNYSQSFWYGINIREETHQQWSSGWQVIFNRWEKNVPFTEGTCAMRSSENTWDRVSCSEKSSFVCETSTDKPPIEENWRCPESSTDWEKANGKLCYLIETEESRSWHDAYYDCTRKGGSLVNIHSKEELNDLYVHLRPLMRPEFMHIGLHRKLSNKSEFELTDGCEVSYQHWLYGQPSNVDEECGTLHTNIMRWNDLSCLVKHRYICSATKVPPAELDEKPCACSCNNCKQDESGSSLVSKEKDSVPTGTKSKLPQITCSEEKREATSEKNEPETTRIIIESPGGANAHTILLTKTDRLRESLQETTPALEQDHEPSLKQENELGSKILIERLNAFGLISNPSRKTRSLQI